MLTGKQRSYLKGLAHNLSAVIQVGKDGITPALINQVSETIEKRELIKITILESAAISTREAANLIAERTRSEFVQAVGRKAVIYRQRKKDPEIVLPQAKQR